MPLGHTLPRSGTPKVCASHHVLHVDNRVEHAAVSATVSLRAACETVRPRPAAIDKVTWPLLSELVRGWGGIWTGSEVCGSRKGM
jgi:hypothetical protein